MILVSSVRSMRIGVIGGGASGIFAAISAASHKTTPTSVTVLEAGNSTLTKVKISGGGRCNVLHDTSKPIPTILDCYPRGNRELSSVFHGGLSPSEARTWFERHGVQLKTEDDGRMFPTTDSSQTIIDCLMEAARKRGVKVEYRCKVDAVSCTCDTPSSSSSSLLISTPPSQFTIKYTQKDAQGVKTNNQQVFDKIIFATGSAPAGYAIASQLGHEIVKTVPSLFTLSTKQAVSESGMLHGLSGLSVSKARISFKSLDSKSKKSTLVQEGPLLITHHGFSGPAALRLSAFGARGIAEASYKGTLSVHWAPELGNIEDVNAALWQCTTLSPRKTISTVCPLILKDGTTAIPKRLWAAMVDTAGLSDKTWSEAPKKLVRQLADLVCNYQVELTGKGTFKEEFVTAGGVNLKEIDMKTMESKKCPGLYFCGEVINVDGVTGGFNFMNCWSTGYVAGKNAAAIVVVAKENQVLS
jgi:predicted Rossmann fold flavoprotein